VNLGFIIALDAEEKCLFGLAGCIARTLSFMRVDRYGRWTGVHVGLDGRLRTYDARYIC
jgi:hypothetical protein